MRYAMIMAGGSGTRLWPMSRARLPKQLLPFINGRSLLQIAMDRLDGVVRPDQIYLCAGQTHRDLILNSVNGTSEDRYFGEPMGRDTLNAVGLVAAERLEADPEASIAVFTADAVIEPVDTFRQIVEQGYQVVESTDSALVTFGIKPTHASTAYGYLELGQPIGDLGARTVNRFKEKPETDVAKQYVAAGPDRFLWNSGMFVWRADTLMECIRRHAPENHHHLAHLGQVYRTDAGQDALEAIYPKLHKISVDYAVMEPASRDPAFQVVAVPMPLTWLDVGSWPAFAETCREDQSGNKVAAARHLLLESTGTLVASSDENHVITAIGCENMIIVHTPDVTLVCKAEQAEQIKQLHQLVSEQFGPNYL